MHILRRDHPRSSVLESAPYSLSGIFGFRGTHRSSSGSLVIPRPGDLVDGRRMIIVSRKIRSRCTELSSPGSGISAVTSWDSSFKS